MPTHMPTHMAHSQVQLGTVRQLLIAHGEELVAGLNLREKLDGQVSNRLGDRSMSMAEIIVMARHRTVWGIDRCLWPKL